MRKITAFTAAVSAFALAPTVHAADLVEFYEPGNPEFTVSGDIFSGPISADIGVSGIISGLFTHTFSFTIPQTGVGSGAVTTSASFLGSSNDTDFLSVLFNGTPITINRVGDGLVETAFATGVPITAGIQNQLVINGLSRGQGSYGGQLTFNPAEVPGAVPESSTWAMMLLGFAAVGFAMRRRRQGHGTTRVRFAFS